MKREGVFVSILVTGGTGFVGKELVNQLILHGHIPYVVSRRNRLNASSSFIAPPAKGELFPSEVIGKVSKVVNLAGESITAHRWNREVKEEIVNSRVSMTRCLVASIRRNREQGLPYPKVLINASAVGYYGTHPSQIFTEENKCGNDFLSNVCQQWEGEAMQAQSLGVRVLCLRFGQILERDGGMLPRVAFPFHFGLGGYLGDGQQWISWIHRKEVIDIIRHALDHPNWQGIYNLTSPHAVTMEEFMEVLGKVIGSKSRMRMPNFIPRLFFGEMAEDLLLKGQHVFPKHLLAEEYTFQYPDLFETLSDIYHK